MEKRAYSVGISSLTLEFGDLTKSSADVLVSSDDSYISMGGGVSAALLRAGGDSILTDAAKKVPAALGDVIVTAAGRLPAKHIFHAITIGRGDLEPKEVIAKATRRCLELLDALGLDSIAFPAIGAGVAGFEYKEVAVHMAEVIVDSLAKCPHKLDVTLYLFDRFGRKQPMDFLDFFEEFAVRTKGLQLTPRTQPHQRQPRAKSPKHKKTQKEQRQELVRELGRLEGERQALEARLADYDGVLPRPEARRVEKRLKEVHKERVRVLSAVKARPAQRAISVFVSYSHHDEKLRIELANHLSVLERQGLIATWHDRMIGPGSEWEGVIDENLERSNVILLLVSSDFVHSKYCYDVEMKRALERHASHEALVIPVMLRPVLLRGMPFATLQALPKDAKPVTKWPDRDSAFVAVTEGLWEAIAGI